jgi:hypothetical protein
LDIPKVIVMPIRRYSHPDSRPIPAKSSPAIPGENAIPQDFIKADPGSGLLLNLKNKPGRCRVCGAAFMGPSNQKYCQEHSPTIKYKGKN